MSHAHHKAAAPKSVAVTLITLSDTRDATNDATGHYLSEALTEAGHSVVGYSILPEEPEAVAAGLELALERADSQVIILNGGTGLARRDITPEVVEPYLDKALPGFGELFRQLSYLEIGSPAMLSRALAGLARGKLIICLPGSTNACRLAMEKLLLPELGHLVYEAAKPKGGV